jgi:histone deacetylase 6
MGVGYSYLGIKMLLTSRNSAPKIAAILNYVTGSLRAVRSETEPRLSHWYKDKSRVYVAADHACWSDEDMKRRVRKQRFGRVVESPEKGLGRMLRFHLEESTEWVGEMVGLGEESEDSGAKEGLDDLEM